MVSYLYITYYSKLKTSFPLNYSSFVLMANLAKLEFVALDITGKNYLSWILDAEIHLKANALRETTKDDNNASN